MERLVALLFFLLLHLFDNNETTAKSQTRFLVAAQRDHVVIIPSVFSVRCHCSARFLHNLEDALKFRVTFELFSS